MQVKAVVGRVAPRTLRLKDEVRGVIIPRVEVHIVVRFGPALRGGVDAHVMGPRQTVHRKVIRGVDRTVSARIDLGGHEAVLGVPVSALVGAPVALEDLWGESARRLCARLVDAPDDAAAILEQTIDVPRPRSDHAQLALHAASRVIHASVAQVALDLGVSERHLRRVFRETTGVGPKTFARLARFRRAVRAAVKKSDASWSDIAVDAGYYDQAHLHAEFRALASATPVELLDELRAAAWIG